jgi:iron complex outermembrane recepter protein
MNTRKPFPSRCTLALAISLCLQTMAQAADTESASVDTGDIFTLGQITVYGQHKDSMSPLGTSKIDSEQMQDLDKTGLPDALNMVPGVASTTGSDKRNESVISVRSFDRYQVPLLLDGIRLYLPADNRIDFDRFLTPDLSQIQVAKGYVSVLNGPDGMGGAINLVTRKPVKPIEGEVMTSFAFANNGQLNGNTSYANVGGRAEKYYFQVSAEHREVNRWRVSEDFTPTAAEDGGDRNHTDNEDKRINLKLGLTPNTTDEYSLNFVKQEGEKHGLSQTNTTSSVSVWDWPKWDTWSTYWLSHSQIGNQSYVNTKAYYNKFDNDLVGYTNTSLTTPSWTSHYDDYAAGMSTEFGTDAFQAQSLKAALHFRRDHHTEWQVTDTTGFSEPKQRTSEDTYSIALEDTWHAARMLDLVGGISRDARRSHESQEYDTTTGTFFNQPTANSFATNYQGAAIYRFSESGKVHLSLSERTRFPTIFERFSSRFGGNLSNPWLSPERARNIEAGISGQIQPALHGEFNVFHSDVDDAIESVNILYSGKTYTQNQNVGKATHDGFELALSSTIGSHLEISGNYSYISTHIHNPNDSTTRLTGVPQHKIFAYAKWTPVEKLSVIPSFQYASSRWSAMANNSAGYMQTKDYALIGLKLQYRVTTEWEVSLSGNNLLDTDYQVADGSPLEGRNYLLSTRYKF